MQVDAQNPALLGIDFLGKLGARIDFASGELYFRHLGERVQPRRLASGHLASPLAGAPIRLLRTLGPTDREPSAVCAAEAEGADHPGDAWRDVIEMTGAGVWSSRKVREDSGTVWYRDVWREPADNCGQAEAGSGNSFALPRALAGTRKK